MVCRVYRPGSDSESDGQSLNSIRRDQLTLSSSVDFGSITVSVIEDKKIFEHDKVDGIPSMSAGAIAFEHWSDISLKHYLKIYVEFTYNTILGVAK